MKGKLKYEHWSVSHMGGQQYIAERIIDGKTEQKYVNAHCLACAKTNVLSKWGGKVDTRGWHKQGICGSFLVAMQQTVDEEEEQ